jgi:putative DNA primase/helicase
LLGQFPFTGGPELAHAVALLLLPFARELIDGPTPLHLIEKPSPGTGGSLLADVLTFPALGRPAGVMTEARSEEEWRKRITAQLRTGASVVLIDNLRECLDSAAVSAAITAPVWEDRLLGVSTILRLTVRCAWVATGNNPQLSNEMTRRAVRIRLDAKVDRPWLRTGWRHPDLRRWAAEHRADLVWAALVLIRAWAAAGRPRGPKALGMFDAWSAVLGGILTVAEIPGFLGNLAEFYGASDLEGATWGRWWPAGGGGSATPRSG